VGKQKRNDGRTKCIGNAFVKQINPFFQLTRALKLCISLFFAFHPVVIGIGVIPDGFPNTASNWLNRLNNFRNTVEKCN
jgi:hypothetical protein